MSKTSIGEWSFGLVVAGAITGVLALMGTHPVLLIGVFVVYLFAVPINFHFRHRVGNSRARLVFAGPGVFGALCLAQGLGPGFDFGALAAGFGLLMLGLGAGTWMHQPASGEG